MPGKRAGVNQGTQGGCVGRGDPEGRHWDGERVGVFAALAPAPPPFASPPHWGALRWEGSALTAFSLP